MAANSTSPKRLTETYILSESYPYSTVIEVTRLEFKIESGDGAIPTLVTLLESTYILKYCHVPITHVLEVSFDVPQVVPSIEKYCEQMSRIEASCWPPPPTTERLLRPSFAPTKGLAPEVMGYRVHWDGAQTSYDKHQGFRSKNQSTRLGNMGTVLRFGRAHLHRQTNVSSPFISYYDDETHAMSIARHFSQKLGVDFTVHALDTRYFEGGPIFKASFFLKGFPQVGERVYGGLSSELLHQGEHLVLHKITLKALRYETIVRADS